VRESTSLVLGGLRERAAVTARVGIRRALADSCSQAVPIWLTLWLVSAVNTPLIAGPSRPLLVQEAVLGAILACALVGYERIAALSAVAALAVFGPLGLHPQLVWLAKVVVPIACLLVMLCVPRERPREARQLLWLVPVCALVTLGSGGRVGLLEVLAVISLVGVVRLFHDPRLAIACGLVWIGVLLSHAVRLGPAGRLGLTGRPGLAGPGLLVLLAFASAGLMLTVAAGRLWIMHRSLPR
jgi:hypothetical protein